MLISFNLWSVYETLNIDDNANFSITFYMEEIKNALFSMEINRTPHPNSIPIDLYQHCWDMVKHDSMHILFNLSVKWKPISS